MKMKEYHRIIFIPGDLRVVYTKTPNKIFLICPELDPFQICVDWLKTTAGRLESHVTTVNLYGSKLDFNGSKPPAYSTATK